MNTQPALQSAPSAIRLFPGGELMDAEPAEPPVAFNLGSAAVRRGRGPLASLLRHKNLYPVFQPIAALGGGAIYAHEALIRFPEQTSFYTPDALLRAAAHENLNIEFENVCVLLSIERWGDLGEPGRLFLNISADLLQQVLNQCGCDFLLGLTKA